MIYRIDKADLQPWLSEHMELMRALAGRAALLATKPAVADTSGVISWLCKNVGRFELAEH